MADNLLVKANYSPQNRTRPRPLTPSIGLSASETENLSRRNVNETCTTYVGVYGFPFRLHPPDDCHAFFDNRHSIMHRACVAVDKEGIAVLLTN